MDRRTDEGDGVMIAALLFDIHGVFLLRSEKRYRSLAGNFGISPEVLTSAIFANGLWEGYKCGDMAEDYFWSTVVSRLPVTFSGTPTFLRDEMDLVDEVDEGLVGLVQTLRAQYRVAALSNAGADLERRLKHFHFYDLFEIVINSHHVHMAKPDEAIYRMAANRLGVLPHEILFIDDKERNTLVADRLGFNTHVYTDLKSFKAYLSSFNQRYMPRKL